MKLSKMHNLIGYLLGVMLMRILGVDPGIATVGFAVLDAEKRSQRLLTCGVITRRPKRSCRAGSTRSTAI